MSENTSPVRVLVADAISPKGIELLESTPGFEVTVKTGMSPEELKKILGDHDALIVRSATKVTADVLAEPGRLRAVGRAGTGVDNIDLEAATKAGVVVMNTPGGNSVAAAELTMALLLALARNVPQSNADLRDGRWERKTYMGTEVAGKVLGVVGLGRIGREVALRAQRFRMEVIGFDPYVSAKVAEAAGIGLRSLDEVIAESDILTLHVPMSADNRHMIDAAAMAKMKPGARIINCARGGLIDESALVDAIESGHLAGAALDVFETEPPTDTRLISNPKIVATPHLGASTREAQERVGTEIAEKIRDFAQNGVILDAVNFPAIDREEYTRLGPAMDLAERLGSFLGQIANGGFKKLELRALGRFGEYTLKPLSMAATRGLLSSLVTGGISYVNALTLADGRGITVEEARSTERSSYSGLLRLTLETDSGTTTVAGTLTDPGAPRLVEVNGVAIETSPEGHMLFFRNNDVPGVVGKIGNLLGNAGVNIAGIQLGRYEGGNKAVGVVRVDGPIPAAAAEGIRSIEEILELHMVSI